MTDLETPTERSETAAVPQPLPSPAPSHLASTPSADNDLPLSAASRLTSRYPVVERDHAVPASRFILLRLFARRDREGTENQNTSKTRLRVQICWLLLAVLILALTIYGYVQALTDAQQRLKQAQSGEQHDFKIGAETSTEQSSSNTKFIHALFCSALVVETFLVAHVAARIGRYLIYRAYYKRQEVALESMSQISEVNSNDVPPRPPSRFVQAFVGPPPTIPSPPKLPNYDHALRQAARQSARRQAARLGVSAGRRGREQFGSGDPEDLEIERIKRLGGLPPTYRSDEMRKSKIVLRGAKLERRSSILSMFSNSAASDEEPNAPSSPASQIGFSGFVHRLMSVKSINNSTYPTSSPNVGQTASLHMTEQSEEEQETPKHPEDKGHNIGGSDSRGTASKQLAREDDCLAEAFITSALPAEALTVILTHDRQELDSIKPDTS